MGQQLLVISGSARRQGNTSRYVEFVLKDIDHILVNLLDFKIAPYNYDAQYPEDDMFPRIVEEMLKHEVILFATPVYWYAMSGLMKALFDRFTDLVTTQKYAGREMKVKSVFLLAVGTEESLPEGFEIPFKLTAAYFDMNYKASIYFSHENPGSEEEENEQRDAFVTELGKC